MSISNKYSRLLARRAPLEDRRFYKFAESFETESGENTKYLLGAMKPIEAKYTKRLIEQGDRVENQLINKVGTQYPGLEFRRQGSVSNSTHIKYYSDVDILVIIDKFITLQPPQRATIIYQGNPPDDLLELRKCCKRELNSAFTAATIDDSGSNAIKIKDGSLICEVDVVPCNWYDTNDYSSTSNEIFRGVMVLNKDTMIRTENYPFLFNHRIEEKDKSARGLIRMLIRLLKTVKADAEDDGTTIDFSSFDICSIIYAMPMPAIDTLLNQPLDIIITVLNWMKAIANNQQLQGTLSVIDETRKIFDKTEKAAEFIKLYKEIDSIYLVAMREHNRAFISESHLK
jgi:hypothetical protein